MVKSNLAEMCTVGAQKLGHSWSCCLCNRARPPPRLRRTIRATTAR
jgi:hypothetical protein